MNKNYKRGQLKPSEHTGYVSNTVDSEYFLLVTSAGYVDNNKDSSDGTGKGFLLLYVYSGELSAAIGDEECRIYGGQAIVFSPDSFYTVNDMRTDKPSIWYYVTFTGSSAEGILTNCGIVTEAVIDVGRHVSFSDNFERLFSVFEDYTESRDIALFDTLAPSHLLKTVGELKMFSEGVVHKYHTEGRIFHAVNYIKKHYKEQLTVEDIARKHHFSPSYFRRLFKAATGQSPIEYISDLRISHACQMLTGGGLSIEKVAQECGFQSLSYFGKTFRSKTKVTPGQYRKENK